ncbi:MAG: HD domain-containing phosphohydrolase [Desulfobacterales bacterium]
MISDSHKLFRILAEVTQAVHTGEDLDAVLLGILASISRVFRARGCTLRTLDPGTNELTLRAATGLSRVYLDKGPVVAGSSISEVYSSGPVIIRSVRADPRVQYPEAAAAEGIVSIIALPFEILGNVRMVLRIYFEEEVDPTPDAIEVLRILAGQGAIAIRNSLLQTRYLETFRRVSDAIHSGNDTQGILEGIVREVTEVMSAMGCIYWIVNPLSRQIEACVCHGFNYHSLTAADYGAIDDIFEPEQRKTVYVEDVRYDSKIPDLERLGKRRVRSLVGIPFPIAEPYVGILAVYFASRRRLIQREFDFLTAVGEQGAISLHRALRYDESRLDTFRQTVEGLVLALEAKDPHTHGHSLKVAHYARLTGAAMGLPEKLSESLYHAGLLHDIGKIGMGDRVLSRLGKLKARELDQVRTHPVIGARIIKPLAFLDDLVPMIRHHHEHYDGRGYPDGLAGEGIPLGARILAACDALETMVSGRPHIPKIPLDAALDQLQSARGTRFDPRVVDALVGYVEVHPDAITPMETPESYWERFRKEVNQPASPGHPGGDHGPRFPTSF